MPVGDGAKRVTTLICGLTPGGEHCGWPRIGTVEPLAYRPAAGDRPRHGEPRFAG